MIVTNSNSAFQKLNLTLADYDDNTEKGFKDFLSKFDTAFRYLVSDIAWLMDNYNSKECKKAIETAMKNFGWKKVNVEFKY